MSGGGAWRTGGPGKRSTRQARALFAPALTSAEPRPEVTCAPQSVHVAAFLDRGMVTVLAANTRNQPQALTVRLPGLDWSGEAEVVFEDRRVLVEGGVIAEPIDAFDTRVSRQESSAL